MSQTLQLLSAFEERLKAEFGRELAVELFPEKPSQYRLNHPAGAILLAYGSSKFSDTDALDAVFQERNLVMPLTLVFRQLNGKAGVIAYLDRIRDCLTGWVPPHCDNACRPLDEVFIGQVAGLWQYAQRFAVRATQLQQMGAEDGPLLTQAVFEEYP